MNDGRTISKKIMCDDNKGNVFKQFHMKHRRRGDDPNRSDDLGECIDFGNSGNNNNDDGRIIRLTLPPTVDESESSLSTSSEAAAIDLSDNNNNIYHGPIFGLKEFPGFLYFPQALPEKLQMEIAYRSVLEYCEKPHRTNIDLCPPKSNEILNHEDRMWELWKDDEGKQINDDSLMKSKKKKRKPNYNNNNNNNKPKLYRSFKKLSWSTMGYHYDWTKREYHEGCKSTMPKLIEDIAIAFARTSLLLEKPTSTSSSSSFLDFTPSASIVNYYGLKSNMGGHKDDLEFAIDKPVVSFSVGLPAIFLLGGKTKENGPVVPILVRPGDVMIMGGDSRLNYHGMARVLPKTVTLPKIIKCHKKESDDDAVMFHSTTTSSSIPKDDEESLEEYLSTHRININVRQVYPNDAQCD